MAKVVVAIIIIIIIKFCVKKFSFNLFFIHI